MSLCRSCMLKDELRDDKFEIGSNRSMFIIHRRRRTSIAMGEKKNVFSFSSIYIIVIIIDLIFQKDLFLKTKKKK